MKKDETELIHLAKEGDEAAVSALYDRHYDAVFNYLYYRVNDQATAEDLTADVFVLMLENIESYTDQGQPILAWLYTIARNRVIDYYRDSDQFEKLPVKDELMAGNQETPSEIIKAQQSQACFRRALYHLTSSQRQVIIHKFLNQMSTTETAEMLDKSEGAVRSLQLRALTALENALEEEGCL